MILEWILFGILYVVVMLVSLLLAGMAARRTMRTRRQRPVRENWD